MTDARLAAAVEAAARAHFAWRVRDDLRPIVEAALAAADVWDREQGVQRFDPSAVKWSVHTEDTQPYRFGWLARLGGDQEATQEPQKPPQDSRAGSGGTPGPQMGDEGTGGGS